jgi:hypothetical protein
MLFIAVEAPLIYWLYEHYVWVFPIVPVLNVLAFWLLVNKVVVNLLVFPYSFEFIQHYMDEVKNNQ